MLNRYYATFTVGWGKLAAFQGFPNFVHAQTLSSENAKDFVRRFTFSFFKDLLTALPVDPSDGILVRYHISTANILSHAATIYCVHHIYSLIFSSYHHGENIPVIAVCFTGFEYYKYNVKNIFYH